MHLYATALTATDEAQLTPKTTLRLMLPCFRPIEDKTQPTPNAVLCF